MAATIRIEVVSSGGVDEVKKEITDLGRTAEQSGGGFSAMKEIGVGALRAIGEAAVNLAGAAFSKLGDVIGDSITAAKESNLVAAQTAAVIKSTGDAAGVTAQHVLDYASSLSAAAGKSLFGDEQIAQSSNLLLTFTNIKGATLDAATAISVDMAQAMGGAPKDAAIQLGKALNDPVKGITALTRVGVTFSDEQKATIKAMQETGDTAGAQAIILAELNKEFGGSAAAAAKADGGFAQFHDRLGEMEETLGKAILPLLGELMGVMNDKILPVVESVASAFSAWVNDPATQASLQQIVTAIQTDLATAFSWMSDTAIPALLSAWETIQPALQAVGAFILDTIVPAIGSLVTWFQQHIPVAIGILTTYWNTTLLPIFNALVDLWMAHLQPALSALGGWLKVNLPIAIDALVGFWTGTLQPAIAALAHIIATVVIPAIGTLVDWLAKNLPVAIQTVSDFWTGTLQPALNTVWAFIKNNVIPILSDVLTWLKTTIPPAIQSLSDLWTNTLQPALKVVWDFINGSVIPIIKTLIEDNIKILQTAVRLLGEAWTNVLQPALASAWAYIDKNIMPILKAVSDAIGTVLQPIIKSISDLIAGAFSSSWGSAKQAIDPIEGAINAVTGAIKNAITWVQNLIDKLDAIHIPGPLQQRSPSPLEQSLLDVTAAAHGLQDALPAVEGMFSTVAASIVDATKKNKEAISDQMNQIVDNLTKQAETLGDGISNAIAGAFSGTASFDRLKAHAIGALKDISDAQQANVQAQLNAADTIASSMTDPQQAAKYFKMRSDQIFEVAKLQDQISKATDEGSKARLQGQLALIMQAQAAEQSASDATAAKLTPMQNLAKQVSDLLAKANTDLKGKLPGVFEDPTIQALTSLIAQLGAVGAPVGAGGGGGDGGQYNNSSSTTFTYAPILNSTGGNSAPLDYQTAKALGGL